MSTHRRRWSVGLFTLALLAGVALLAVAQNGSAHAGGDEDDDWSNGEGTPQEELFFKRVRFTNDLIGSVHLFNCLGSINPIGTVTWVCGSVQEDPPVRWHYDLDPSDEPTISDFFCHRAKRDDCRGERSDGAADGDGAGQPESGGDPSVLIVETLTEEQYWYAIHWGITSYQAQRQAYVYDPYYGRLVPTDDPWGGRTFSSDDPYAR